MPASSFGDIRERLADRLECADAAEAVPDELERAPSLLPNGRCDGPNRAPRTRLPPQTESVVRPRLAAARLLGGELTAESHRPPGARAHDVGPSPGSDAPDLPFLSTSSSTRGTDTAVVVAFVAQAERVDTKQAVVLRALASCSSRARSLQSAAPRSRARRMDEGGRELFFRERHRRASRAEEAQRQPRR